MPAAANGASPALREAPRLWLEQQNQFAISVITSIEVLAGCRDREVEQLEARLERGPRLPLDQAIARETVQLRQRHGLKGPDAIVLATASCQGLTLATRNSRDFPLSLGGVVHPNSL